MASGLLIRWPMMSWKARLDDEQGVYRSKSSRVPTPHSFRVLSFGRSPEGV
jgi:hypothetical protein